MNSDDRYDSLYRCYAQEYGNDWLYLKAQGRQESGFNPDAVNLRSGCKGVAQFADATFAQWSRQLKIKNPSVWNPEHSIRCQAAYMRWLTDRLDGELLKALAAYNWGIGNLQRLLAEAPATWRAALPGETDEYIAIIPKTYERYRREIR